MNKPVKTHLGICASFLLVAIVCSAQERNLPEKKPEPHTIEFTGPEEGWPPRPKGRTNVQQVRSKEILRSLTEAREAAIRRAALRDLRVRKLLGDRFAYISTDEVEPAKRRTRRPAGPLATRVTFYSHTNNVAVEVQMVGTRVRGVRRNEGFQPPEGAEEIATAIKLAQGDPRLRDHVGGLNSFAILTPASKGHPASGHRVLHVTFSKGEDLPPLYFAFVDLTDQKVLLVGGPIKD